MCQRQALANLLRDCSKSFTLDKGLKAHGSVLRLGFESDLMLNNDLISMYGKCTRIGYAQLVFDKMPERNVVSWTALIGCHLQNGNAEKCLSLFPLMIASEVEPNEFTLSTVLKAAGILGLVENAAMVHGNCTKSGLDGAIFVGNSIIDTYAKLGKIAEAAKMFEAMPFKNLISWNTMIAGFAGGGEEGNGDGKRALVLFRDMQRYGEIADEYSFTSALKACGGLGAFRQGREIHSSLITRGLWDRVQVAVSGALVNMYVKSGKLNEARSAFERMETKTAVSRSALILGFAQNDDLKTAMELFRELRRSTREIMDEFVLSSLVGVFADLALVEQGKQLHALTLKLPSGSEVSVANSILDMYHKCGSLSESERVFDEIEKKRNVISWTSMITGYGKHGYGRRATELFNQMSLHGLVPDGVAYLAVLTACSHAGLINEGREIFQRLCRDRRVKPRVEHYSCMVDLLGRAGRLREARQLIDSMPLRPTAAIWQTMLGACRVHGDLEMGKEIGERLLRIDDNNMVNYVMLSNLYADSEQWQDYERVWSLTKSKGLKKDAGRSWVEVEKEVHFFYNRDDNHPMMVHIREFLKDMEMRLRQEIGYAPSVAFAMRDVEDESKEESLRVHSEKLAIGLALLCGGLETKRTIKIFKNLRVCGDCHSFIKGLSQILEIVFLVRDANRFHKFEGGKCSCGDYW